MARVRNSFRVFGDPPPAPLTAPGTYVVDWTAYADAVEISGTSVPTGWAAEPSGTGRMRSTIVTDGSSVQGKALKIWSENSSGARQLIAPTEVTAALASCTSYIEVLTKFRMPSNLIAGGINRIHVAAFNVSGGEASGLFLRPEQPAARLVSNASVIPSADPGTTSMLTIAASTAYWFRCRWDITGTKISGKVWTSSEPGSFTDISFSGLTPTMAGIGATRDGGTPKREYLCDYLSYGLDMAAP